MNYDEALRYLYAHEDRERLLAGNAAQAFDLRRVQYLLQELGDPQLGRVTVHVAGTKGKGSVAAMVASVLQAAGFRTGLYTSPHLCDFRERFRVDGRAITPDSAAAVVDRVRAAAETYHLKPPYGRLTTFELATAAAFLHFRDEGATAQVLEVGLGGRLDATNVIPTPDVAIITPISYDHTEVLGTTLAAIAAEKAGIIKAGGASVTAPQEPEAASTIARRCYEVGATLTDVGSRARWERTEADLDGQRFHLNLPTGSLDIGIPLLGAFQIENAVTAAVACDVLRSRLVPVRRQHVMDGLARVRWPGRVQVVRRDPVVVLDGAHNGASARRLAEVLRQDIRHRRLTLVVGIARDKDIAAIAAELGPIADQVVATQFAMPRSASPEAIAKAFGLRCTTAPAVACALHKALAEAEKEDAVCVTGSLYVVGEALQALDLQDDVLDLVPGKVRV